MPAYQKSINLNHGYFVVGVWCVFVLKNEVINKEILFLVFNNLFYFLGVAYALISATFRANKITTTGI